MSPLKTDFIDEHGRVTDGIRLHFRVNRAIRARGSRYRRERRGEDGAVRETMRCNLIRDREWWLEMLLGLVAGRLWAQDAENPPVPESNLPGSNARPRTV